MLIASLFYFTYLVMDARQDSVYIRKYGRIYHGWNWALKALTVMGIGYAHYQNWWSTAAYSFLWVPLTWIVFDFVLNAFLGKNPITYIGSGSWDELFKWVFDKRYRRRSTTESLSPKPVMAMWIAKILLLAIAIGIFLECTE